MRPFCVRRLINTTNTASPLMWWFTPSGERTMARRYKKRQSYAQQLSRDKSIPRLAERNAALIAESLRLAKEDEPLFERLFGEPMPAQLRIALRVEVTLWTELKNKQPNDYRRLPAIEEILRLERQMLHTPLVRRYQRAIDRLRRAVGR